MKIFFSSEFLVHVGNIIQVIILVGYDAVISGSLPLSTGSLKSVLVSSLFSVSPFQMFYESKQTFKSPFLYRLYLWLYLDMQKLCGLGLACEPCAQHFSLLFVQMTPTACTVCGCLGVLGSRHALEWWGFTDSAGQEDPQCSAGSFSCTLQAFPARVCSSRVRCRSVDCRSASELQCSS